MAKLIPEVRVDKNGRSVTKHVRATPKASGAGFLAKMIPMLSGSKTKALDLEHLTNEIEQEFAAGKSQGMDKDYVNKIARGYSARTISVIKDAYSGTGLVTPFIGRTYSLSERDIRAICHYKDQIKNSTYSTSQILKDVRFAMEIKELDEIPPGTIEYEIAKGVIEVAIKSSSGRQSDFEERVERAEAEGFSQKDAAELIREEMRLDGTGDYMSHEMVQLISEVPERASDIARYLDDKKLSVRRVDMELLEMYLNSETPAIADGML